MGFDMTAYSLSKETNDTISQNQISNFHAFYSDPNIGVLEELMEILPPIKVADSEWDVDVFDGICSIESIKKAKESFKIEMCKSVEVNISIDANGIQTSEMTGLDYPFEKINKFLDEIIKNAKTAYIGLTWG
ncbi:hypothetical protein [Enterococcus faecalis]|uniref:hypothetical protein n=1 Tax=Enterococcus faecalis TaxID=1351 RepID=UPI00045B2322|nr:hypothetical protein [Enterococcus faecalis]KAJ85603.1 hypothetical protein P791_1202 [Enterococcus faecalis NY9]